MFSQDEIIQNDWYLQKIIYDGNEYSTPSNDEINVVTLRVEEDEDTNNLYYLNTWGVCNSGAGGMMSYVTNESFSFFDISGTYPSNCENPDNEDFADIYLAFYILNFENDFPYLITNNEDGSKTLVINNIEGNQAIYTNQLMSFEEYVVNNLFHYPNPVIEKLTIENLDLKIRTIKIVEATGKVILTEKISLKRNEIDLSNFPKGTYFILFEENGIVIKTEKIIKK